MGFEVARRRANGVSVNERVGPRGRPRQRELHQGAGEPQRAGGSRMAEHRRLATPGSGGGSHAQDSGPRRYIASRETDAPARPACSHRRRRSCDLRGDGRRGRPHVRRRTRGRPPSLPDACGPAEGNTRPPNGACRIQRARQLPPGRGDAGLRRGRWVPLGTRRYAPGGWARVAPRCPRPERRPLWDVDAGSPPRSTAPTPSSSLVDTAEKSSCSRLSRGARLSFSTRGGARWFVEWLTGVWPCAVSRRRRSRSIPPTRCE